MKYLGVIIDPKDLVTKEYVDNAVLGGTSTFYRKYENTYITSNVPISTIPIGMNIVTSADMIFVDINGLDLIQDVDYTISGTNIILTTPISIAGQNVHIILLRMVNVTASDYNALKGDPGDVSDVLVNNNSVVSNGIASITPSALIDIFYPVGSYYETSDTTFDPNFSWGGTWVKDSAGKVTVAQDTSDTAFDTIGETGGVKDAILASHTHTLTRSTDVGVTVSAHGVTVTQPTIQLKVASPSNTGTLSTSQVQYGRPTGTNYTNANAVSKTNVGVSLTNNHSVTVTQPKFTADTRGETVTNKNLQPYIVVNRWHRTA